MENIRLMEDKEFFLTVLSGLFTLEAILFGVFGFLYGVYAQYMGSISGEGKTLKPPEICFTISEICRYINGLIISIAVLAIILIWSLPLVGCKQYLLASLLTAILIAIVLPSLKLIRKIKLRN